MGTAGVKHSLCVNQQVGVATLEQRCKGFYFVTSDNVAKVIQLTSQGTR